MKTWVKVKNFLRLSHLWKYMKKSNIWNTWKLWNPENMNLLDMSQKIGSRKLLQLLLGGHSLTTFLAFFDHLLTLGWHLQRNSFTVISENLHTVDISCTTYLPYLVNIVYERPLVLLQNNEHEHDHDHCFFEALKKNNTSKLRMTRTSTGTFQNLIHATFC